MRDQSIPDEARQSIAEHERALERVLKQLESAATSVPPVKPETFGTIAEAVRGVTLSLLEDARRLENRASFFQHRAR